MKQFHAFIFLALPLLFSACKKVEGDGPVVTQTRGVTGFSGIDLRVQADVYFKQDSVYKLEVSAQQNILDVLETYVSNGSLVVKFKNDVRVRSYDPVRVTVSGPALSSVRLSGSGNVNATGKLA